MRPKYDSEFCGSLPLNFINNIQDYGVLLVMDPKTLTIVQTSQNTEEWLGVDHEKMVKTQLSDYIAPEVCDVLMTTFSTEISEKLPFTFVFQIAGAAKSFHALVHRKDDFLIAEIDTNSATGFEDSSFIAVYQKLKYSIASLEKCTTVAEVCDTAIRHLKSISGFDRIMAYQFDEDWNGVVVAEVLEPGMEPYLGLHFPASDIPAQARALYQKNSFRLIPNRDYTPVKLYPVINPVTQSFIDLSDCNLRSVATVHLKYLKNMNVAASMSTRILVDDKLWGLISCHHREPKFLSYEICCMFELLSGVISSKITSLEKQQLLQINGQLQSIQSQLIEKIYDTDLIRGLTEGPVTLLHLLKADGAVILFDKEMEEIGNVPDRQIVEDLVYWLQTKEIATTFATDSIAETYDDAYQHSKIASGMIVLPIHPGKGAFIIGFRPEVVQKVQWGGNPEERIQIQDDGQTYNPRNSFKLWEQMVEKSSLPWQKEEIAMAENFRHILVEYAIKRASI